MLAAGGLTVSAPGLANIAANLAVALTCGLTLSTLYRRTYRGSSYSVTFDRALVTLSLITAIVIMVIGNNLARAFGLVGAMSIIRFRTALKDPQDLVFVFFSLAVGLAAGVGLYSVALLGTLVICAVILVFARTNYGMLSQHELVLQFTYGAGDRPGAASYTPVLDEYCRTHRLLNVKSAGQDDSLSLTFYVTLAEAKDAAVLAQTLGAVPDVSRVNLFYDEEPR